MSVKIFHICTVILLATIFSAKSLPRRDGIEDYENYLNEIHIDDEDADDKNRNAVQSPLQRWPSTTLYYRISTNFTEEEVQNVEKALQFFNEETCLHFVKYDEKLHKSRKYIYYKPSPNMCGTRVGYNMLAPMGTHDVVMSPYCLNKVGVIQHETLHVLGLYHEQSRPDRDKYVEIEYSNIPQKYWSQFISYSELYTTTYNVPYDYESVMHYSQYAFSKDPSKPTIRAKNGDEVFDREMGQTNGPSEGDLTKIRIMYDCQ